MLKLGCRYLGFITLLYMFENIKITSFFFNQQARSKSNKDVQDTGKMITFIETLKNT